MAEKQLGKKGVFLTFIAISIIATLMMVFLPSDVSLEKDLEAIKTRVSNVNEFVQDLENVYLERTLYVSGIKTLTALIRYMEAKGEFLADFDHIFRGVLVNGTVGYPPQPIDDFIDPDIMTDNTYQDWIDKIITASEESFNVNTSFVINDIQVYQIRPWFVNIDANISFSVSSESATWLKNALIKTEIGIEKFDDPYHSIKTNGAYTDRINKSSVKFDEWHVENLSDHIRYRTYTHWEDGNAPSFLQRFEGDTTPSSCCGIESIVDPSHATIDDIYVSYVDYIFFESWESPPICDEVPYDLYEIDGIDPQFDDIKLRFSQVMLYNRTVDAQKICPT